ncbi:hypothetical protein DFJ63DRAFT_70072 [Scheffersomyces coipomensis]|uniref:uncharacterized protein n=1 Tax=Scheffersomyces coipomensis TaxID=1788519 RepID=UPI00315D4730
MKFTKNVIAVAVYVLASTMGMGWSLFQNYTTSFNNEILLMNLTSDIHLKILLNYIVVVFLVIGKVSQMIIFGELRVIEVEKLFDYLPMFLFNLLLNLTTFDDSILNCFLFCFSALNKFLHIVLFERLNYLTFKITNNDSISVTSRLAVLRQYLFNHFVWLNIIFIITDFSIAKVLVYDVFQGINSVVCLLFGFQFAIQGVENLTYFCKLLVNLYEVIFYIAEQDEDDDIDNDEAENIWELKPYYSKSIDIISSLLQAGAHLGFIYLLTIGSGIAFPFSMIQGTLASVKDTYKEVTQLIKFIQSSKRLETQLPDATKENLETENVCIICRDDMYSVDEYNRSHPKNHLPSRRYPKKLKCGHILHMGCLKDWLERSDNCPLCRQNVFDGPIPAPTPTVPEGQAQPPQQAAVQDQGAAPAPQAAAAAEPVNNPNQDIGVRLAEFAQVINRRLGTLNDDDDNNNTNNTNTNNDNNNNIHTNENHEVDSEDNTTGSTSSGESDLHNRKISPSNQFHIEIPKDSLAPPGWTVLPIEKADEDKFIVSFSRTAQGKLTIRKR